MGRHLEEYMTINRRTLMAAGAGFAVAGVSTTAQAADHKVTVDARNSKWLPAMLKIKAGDTVIWTNTAPIPHIVTFAKAKSKTPDKISLPAGVAEFESPSLKKGQTFQYTFKVKGTYNYTCRLHENMMMFGTIVVA